MVKVPCTPCNRHERGRSHYRSRARVMGVNGAAAQEIKYWEKLLSNRTAAQKGL